MPPCPARATRAPPVTSRVPSVSVCIRTHDRPEDLRGAVASALAQGQDDLEVVVADDSSDDAAGRVLAELADPRLRRVRVAPPGGPAAALRTALDAARAPLLALLDDDDRWRPGYLDAVLAPLHADPEVGVVFTGCWFVVGDRRIAREIGLRPGRHDDLLTELVTRSPVLPSACVLRRELWEASRRELPVLDHGLGVATVVLRAGATGVPFFYVDEPLVDYRYHPGQFSRRPENTRRDVAMLERFAFDDARAEAARRRRLARGRMLLAGVELRAGRLRRGGRAVRRARADRHARLTPGDWVALSGLQGAVSRRTLDRPAVMLALRAIWLGVGGLTRRRPRR